MPPKKRHVGRKFKGKSDNAVFRANKAASDAAVANVPGGDKPKGGQVLP